MSVIANYVRLSTASLELLRSDRNWERSLCERQVPDAALIDIDKACDGLVWLLSRVPAPPPIAPEGSGFVLVQSLAGRPQGEGGAKEPRLVAGYGPAQSLTIEQVREFGAWIAGIAPEMLRSRYDPQRMADEDVYPNVWMEEGEAAFTGYLLPAFQALQQFFARAAAAEQQVLVFFS